MSMTVDCLTPNRPTFSSFNLQLLPPSIAYGATSKITSQLQLFGWHAGYVAAEI